MITTPLKNHTGFKFLCARTQVPRQGPSTPTQGHRPARKQASHLALQRLSTTPQSCCWWVLTHQQLLMHTSCCSSCLPDNHTLQGDPADPPRHASPLTPLTPISAHQTPSGPLTPLMPISAHQTPSGPHAFPNPTSCVANVINGARAGEELAVLVEGHRHHPASPMVGLYGRKKEMWSGNARGAPVRLACLPCTLQEGRHRHLSMRRVGLPHTIV